jgi:hypothetical protein
MEHKAMLHTTCKHRTYNKWGTFLMFWAHRGQRWWKQILRGTPKLERLILIPDSLRREGRQMEDSQIYMNFNQKCKKERKSGE